MSSRPPCPCAARRMALLMVLLAAAAGPARAADRIGIFWDDEFSLTDTATSGPYEEVVGHVVILDPSVGGGILAWECEAMVDGPALFVGWTIAGQGINVFAPPRFAVGLGAPLPPAPATAVATFRLLVTDPVPVRLGLEAIPRATLEGSMSYTAADQPLRVNALTTTTGQEFVARVNADVPVFDVEPTLVNLREVFLGQIVDTVVTIRNVGGGRLDLDIGLDCEDNGWEMAGFSGAISLAGGATLRTAVRFRADTLGLAECRLRFGDQLPEMFMTAVAVEPRYQYEVCEPVEFGSTRIGRADRGEAWIRNLGNVPMLLAVTLTGDTQHFTFLYGGGPVSLAPGAVHTVGVQSYSWEPGVLEAAVSFGQALPSVPLTAVYFQYPPDYRISPTELDFGTVLETEARVIELTISNLGEGPDAVFSVVPSVEPAGSDFQVAGAGLPLTLSAGRMGKLRVTFAPTGGGARAATLHLGDDFSDVPLTGEGIAAIRACEVSADTLDLLADNVYAAATRRLTVRNLGNVPLDLAPRVEPPLFTIAGGYAERLAPGAATVLEVVYDPVGNTPVSADLDLGPDACSSVHLTGLARITLDPSANLVGMFFDDDYDNSSILAPPGALVPVHLVLCRVSDTSGVVGWECQVLVSGKAQFASVDLNGQAINIGDAAAGEYLVGIASPIPYAAHGIRLATLNYRVLAATPISFELRPVSHPALAGHMCWVPAREPLRAQPMLVWTGYSLAAYINDAINVGVELPSPRAASGAGGIELVWSAHMDGVDGYHVYRRGSTGAAVRLTQDLLEPAGTVRYVDRPDPSLGGVLHYSYAAVLAGVEKARSPETTVTLAAGVPARARLLANVPNPFNPATRVRYQVARSGPVRIAVYDMTGRRVRMLLDATQEAGEREVTWRGDDDAGRAVASGTYCVRLTAEGRSDTRAVTLLR